MGNSGSNPARVDMTELPRYYRELKRPWDKTLWCDLPNATRRKYRQKLRNDPDVDIKLLEKMREQNER